MIKNIQSQCRTLALVLGSAALLVGCDRLVSPNFETEVTELRGGGYTLDKDHAALIFKINHLGFSANTTFQRSNHGLDNMVSFGVGDDIELEIHVEFQDAD